MLTGYTRIDRKTKWVGQESDDSKRPEDDS